MEVFKSKNGEMYRVLERGNCQKHGPFLAKIEHWVGTTKDGQNVFGLPHEGKCPCCMDDEKNLDVYGQLAIPPRFQGKTLESYVAETPEQKRVKAVFTGYASNLAQYIREGRSIVMTGRPGTGKTHLACALLSAAKRAGFTGLFTSVGKIVRNVRSTWRGNASEEAAIQSYVNVDLLVIDEVGVQAGSDNEQQILFAVINGRYEEMKPTVIISNLDLVGVQKYIGERAFDRLRENGGQALCFCWDSKRSTVVVPEVPVEKNPEINTETVLDTAVHPNGLGSAEERFQFPDF